MSAERYTFPEQEKTVPITEAKINRKLPAPQKSPPLMLLGVTNLLISNAIDIVLPIFKVYINRII